MGTFRHASPPGCIGPAALAPRSAQTPVRCADPRSHIRTGVTDVRCLCPLPVKQVLAEPHTLCPSTQSRTTLWRSVASHSSVSFCDRSQKPHCCAFRHGQAFEGFSKDLGGGNSQKGRGLPKGEEERRGGRARGFRPTIATLRAAE